MVFLYNTTSLEILSVRADEGDGVKQTNLIALFNAVKQAGEDVFALVDNATVLNFASDFLVDQHPNPTATVQKKSILVTPVTNPIDLNQTSILNIQLRKFDLSNDPVSTTVTLATSMGIIIPASVTTDSNGFSSVAVYKPGKFVGSTGIIASSAAHRQLKQEGRVFITINSPTDSDKQGWLETNDVQPEAITFEKRSTKETIRKTGLQEFWFINKSRLTQSFAVGLNNSINSILADDMGFIYVNGFVDAGQTNAALKKINKDDGTVAGTFDNAAGYTNDNLTSRLDGLTYDGTDIWIAAAGHILKVNAITMVLNVDLTPGGISDGNFQFLQYDGEFVWAQRKGGVSAQAGKLLKLNLDGTVAATIDYRVGDSQDPTVSRDIKQTIMDDQFIYLAGTNGTNMPDWDRIDKITSTVLHRGGGFNGTVGVAVDSRSRHAYFAGGSPGDTNVFTLEDTNITQGSPKVIATNGAIDTNIYDLMFDGVHVWAITSPTAGARRFVRKIKFNPGAGTLDVIQSFDIGTAFDPTDLMIASQYIYVAGFGTNAGIKKIFIGR